MDLDDYVELAAGRTCARAETFIDRFQTRWIIDLDHAARGLTTEVGELQDVLKKYFVYGKEIDTVHVIEELGDIMWYVSLACKALGVSLTMICLANINKLRKRFPDKFTEENALVRDLTEERKALESQ